MNQKNDGNRCFQHAATISLHYEKVGKNPQRIMWSFGNGIYWYFLQRKNDWVKIEKINSPIAYNV